MDGETNGVYKMASLSITLVDCVEHVLSGAWWCDHGALCCKTKVWVSNALLVCCCWEAVRTINLDALYTFESRSMFIRVSFGIECAAETGMPKQF